MLEFDKYSGVKKSLHIPINCKIKQVTIVGFINGATTLKNNDNGPHPSMIAASSNSTGIEEIKFRIVKIQKGIMELINAIMIPGFVLARLKV